MLVSGVQQSGSVVYLCRPIFCFQFFSITVYYKLMNVVPCAIYIYIVNLHCLFILHMVVCIC